jgi:hypothetical protein
MEIFSRGDGKVFLDPLGHGGARRQMIAPKKIESVMDFCTVAKSMLSYTGIFESTPMDASSLAERKERLSLLISRSVLLSDLEKSELAKRVSTATNPHAVARMEAHFENEKRFILDFLKTVAKNDETGQTALELQQGMRLMYGDLARQRERAEEADTEPVDLSQAFA